ncbi:uncharacterized protein DMAD_06612 [Drosophila madeirensis]|uniref:Uncharacterized protein n=1 Tax=Drosophila madeirensis TaxID=30013 RepID=A0AAU9FRN0_DROMD
MEEQKKELQDGAAKHCPNCKDDLRPEQLFEDNVEDIAKSLAQIMLICGINTSKCCQVKSIIKSAFVYHEKARTQCSPKAQPAVSIDRDNMLHALHIKCEMERMEAMLAYSIIKRAFKAFFHGKPAATVSSPVVDAMAIISNQPAWTHAAFKTSQLFDQYQAAFFWAHKSYEKQINAIYTALYKRMKARCATTQVSMCRCGRCFKQSVPGAGKSSGKRVPQKLTLKDGCDLPKSCILCGLQVPSELTTGPLVNVKLPRPIRNPEVDLQSCDVCHSQFLICECNIDQLTGEQQEDCGQDSYKVKWYRLEDEETQTKTQWPPYIGFLDTKETEEQQQPSSEDWENHHCPVDCQHDSSSREDTFSSDSDFGSSNVCDDDDSSDCPSSYRSCTHLQENTDRLEAYLKQMKAK